MSCPTKTHINLKYAENFVLTILRALQCGTPPCSGGVLDKEVDGGVEQCLYIIYTGVVLNSKVISEIIGAAYQDSAKSLSLGNR